MHIKYKSGKSLGNLFENSPNLFGLNRHYNFWRKTKERGNNGKERGMSLLPCICSSVMRTDEVIIMGLQHPPVQGPNDP